MTRSGDLVEFRVMGDGFLYNMVRIMVGTLLPLNRSRLKPGDITRIVESKERSRAGITVPPDGLYLNRVLYGDRLEALGGICEKERASAQNL